VERCRIIAEKFKKKHPSVYTLSVRTTQYCVWFSVNSGCNVVYRSGVQERT